MKSNTIFQLILIAAGAALLRLLFIDKPEGMWFDELVMYNQAAAGGIMDVINAETAVNVHFPLYQIMLSFWMKLFGNNDAVLRLFSVLAGVLSVIAAFFAGREFKDEKTGLLAAFLSAASSIYIFYSQEVKFYIFLVLYAYISLWSISGIIKHSRPAFYAGFALSSAAIAYTFTIGSFYIAAQFAAVLLFLIFTKNKTVLKKFLIANSILILLLIPYFIYLSSHFSVYTAVSRIYTSNIYTFFILLQNFFTPCIISIYDNPEKYIPPLNIIALPVIYAPIAIMLYGIYKSLKTDKSSAVMMLMISVFFILSEIILCFFSGFRILTRYALCALPALIVISAAGLSELKAEKLKIIAVYIFCINVLFLIFSPMSAVRGYRDTGYKSAADILNRDEITDDDCIVIAVRKNTLDKYLNFNGRKFSLIQEFLYEPYISDAGIQDSRSRFKSYVLNTSSAGAEFEKDFAARVINPMKENSRLYYIFINQYNIQPVKSEEQYNKLPVLRSALSKMNADALKTSRKYLELTAKYPLKYYTVYVFEKTEPALYQPD